MAVECQGNGINASHVNTGSVETGIGTMETEGGVEFIARARDIGRARGVTSGTDNEAVGVERIARPRDINSDEQDVERPVHARDINASNAIGPKGLALPKWDVKEHAAAAHNVELNNCVQNDGRGAHSLVEWYVPVDSIKNLVPPASSSAEDSRALVLGNCIQSTSTKLTNLGYQVEQYSASASSQQPDARRLPFSDERFALVHDCCSIDGMPPESAARRIREAHRVLKSNGTYICISRVSRTSMISNPLPGLGMPAWKVTAESQTASVEASVMRDAQMELAKQLGALHQCIPADGAEREGLKKLTKAAMAPDAKENARADLEDEAVVLCKLHAPHVHAPLANALRMYFAAKTPLPAGAHVHSCVRSASGIHKGEGSEEGLMTAMEHMESVLGMMRVEESNAPGADDLRGMLLPLVEDEGGADKGEEGEEGGGLGAAMMHFEKVMVQMREEEGASIGLDSMLEALR